MAEMQGQHLLKRGLSMDVNSLNVQNNLLIEMDSGYIDHQGHDLGGCHLCRPLMNIIFRLVMM